MRPKVPLELIDSTRVAEVRMVHDIDHIQPQLQGFRFVDLDPFDHVHVEIETSRATDRHRAEIAGLSRLRIHQDDVPCRILQGPVVVAGEHTVAVGRGRDACGCTFRRNLGETWVGYRCPTVEIVHAVRRLGNLATAQILLEVTHDVRVASASSNGADPS